MAWMPRALASLCCLSLASALQFGSFAEDKPAEPPTTPKPAEKTPEEKEAERAKFAEAVELQLKTAKETEQPADLAKQIAQGIEQLEGKKHAEFLKAFVHPEEYKALIAKRGSEDEFVKHFAEARAASMLERLKYVKDKKVWITADGNTAVFDLKASNIKDVRAYLNLVKVDGKWFMKNK
jgi:hypothetical protein